MSCSFRIANRTGLLWVLLVGFMLMGTGGCGKPQPEEGSVKSSGLPAMGSVIAEQVPTTEGAATGVGAATDGATLGQANPGIGGESTGRALPDGVPAYPGAIRVESLRIAEQGSEVKAPAGVVMFVSAEPDRTRVVSWYERKLVSNGWSVEERSDDGEYTLFQMSGKGLSVSVESISEPKPDGHADANLLIVIDAN